MVLLAVHQPARRGREREVQRRAHPGRDGGARDRDRRRLLRDGPGRRRHRPGRVVRLRRTTRASFLAVTAATVGRVLRHGRVRGLGQHGRGGQGPERIFPRIMLTGLGVAVLIYVLVAISVVAVLTPGELADVDEAEGRALLEVVAAGCTRPPDRQDLPVPRLFAVANTALINMLMASRLLYGMAKQDVLPRVARQGARPSRRTPWAAIVFSTVLALGLIWYVASDAESDGGHQPGRRRPRCCCSACSRSSTSRASCCVATARPADSSGHPGSRRSSLRSSAPSSSVRGPTATPISLRDRRRAAGDRRRALGAHLADQPRRPREEDRIPRHRPPRGVTTISP